MKKVLKFMVFILAFSLLTAVIYFYVFFELLPVERNVLYKSEVLNGKYYELVGVFTGATSQDVVELKSSNLRGESFSFGVKELFGIPDEIDIVEKKDSLMVLLKYTSNFKRVDTLMYSYSSSKL